jgi:heptosyltransferase-2
MARPGMSKWLRVQAACAGPVWPVGRLGELWFKLTGRRDEDQQLDPGQVQNVLIVRLDDIGDMVLTSPMLRELRTAMPDAWITLVVKPSVKDLIERCPYVDQILTYNPGSPGRFRSWRLVWRALVFARHMLWDRKYDLAILPRFDIDRLGATFIAYFSGAQHRIGYSENVTAQKQYANHSYDTLLSHVVNTDEVHHEVHRSLELIRSSDTLGIHAHQDNLELWLDETDRHTAEALLPPKEASPCIVLGLGASHPRKQWPLDHFVELASWLIDHYNAQIVTVGSDSEKFLGLELAAKLQRPVTNLVGQTTLRQAAALLQLCDVFIGNDSGPMHLAAAGGTPCVQICCHPATGTRSHAAAPERFHPWDVGYRTIQPRAAILPCKDSCEDDRAHCILALGVELVQLAFEDLMARQDLSLQRRGVSGKIQLPTISIIVPNYNGGETLEQTLQCLVDQNYPNLEIIVVDGGSTDNSIDIIKKFDSHTTWWCSEKDQGQTHAINKGFENATGQIVNWLCSDDLLTDGALRVVGEHFARAPQIDVLVGRTRVEFDDHPDRNYIDSPSVQKIRLLPINNAFSQQSCFYRRKLLQDRPSPLDETYNYAMDLELWAYFKYRGVRWRVIKDELGIFRNSATNKTTTGGVKVTYEFEKVYRRYNHERIPLTLWHRWIRYPLEKYRDRHRGVLGYLARPLQIGIVLLLGPFYGFRRVRAMNWGGWV